MAEKVLIKTIGGPQAATRVVDRGKVGWAWPPPGQITVPGYSGFYKREMYSELPRESTNSNLMRGAQYRWVENAD